MRPILEALLGIIAHHIRGLLLNPVDLGVAAIVENTDGQVVLVRHSYRSGLLFPGGAVDHNEHPAKAILRELSEEIGLTKSAPPELLGCYMRKGFWVSNLLLLYRVREAEFSFKKNWEIRELVLADPLVPPPGTSAASVRRLQEVFGGADSTPRW